MSYPAYDMHRRLHPRLYWAAAVHSPRDARHMETLIAACAVDLLDRAERGEIALRDAVGVLKRRAR